MYCGEACKKKTNPCYITVHAGGFFSNLDIPGLKSGRSWWSPKDGSNPLVTCQLLYFLCHNRPSKRVESRPWVSDRTKPQKYAVDVIVKTIFCHLLSTTPKILLKNSCHYCHLSILSTSKVFHVFRWVCWCDTSHWLMQRLPSDSRKKFEDAQNPAYVDLVAHLLLLIRVLSFFGMVFVPLKLVWELSRTSDLWMQPSHPLYRLYVYIHGNAHHPAVN